MAKDNKNTFSASEPALGYIYQSRFALLRLFQLPEDTSVFIEKDDDVDFINSDGKRTLGSLKHKSEGDRLTNLSIDFWKSVRIWLERYERYKKMESNLQFFLFTTANVASESFLIYLTPNRQPDSIVDIVQLADSALAKTTSQGILPIKNSLEKLNHLEKEDFYSRITILDNSPRIEEIPNKITNLHMRTIQREYRPFVFERLEGWWTDLVINLLTGRRKEGVDGYELSDKLSKIAEQYKSDNLPIDFRGKEPEEEIDPQSDSRLFVKQLRELGISSNRIRKAILDYYQAFSQRASWARENVLFEGEIEDYENLLIDEWERYRDIMFDSVNDEMPENKLKELGKQLYNWAEMETSHLRIRDRVSESYIVRGSYHILANGKPTPKVYWHPLFWERLESILNV